MDRASLDVNIRKAHCERCSVIWQHHSVLYLRRAVSWKIGLTLGLDKTLQSKCMNVSCFTQKFFFSSLLTWFITWFINKQTATIHNKLVTFGTGFSSTYLLLQFWWAPDALPCFYRSRTASFPLCPKFLPRRVAFSFQTQTLYKASGRWKLRLSLQDLYAYCTHVNNVLFLFPHHCRGPVASWLFLKCKQEQIVFIQLHIMC